MSIQISSAASKLKGRAVATQVHVKWWGTTKACEIGHHKEVAEQFSANDKMLRLSKSLINTKNPYYAELKSVQTELRNYWAGITIPYIEKGIRLLNQEDFNDFKLSLQNFKQQVKWKSETLADRWPSILQEAQACLGNLWNPSDYPTAEALLDRFDITWDFPEIQPPAWLKNLDPEEYERQCQVVAAKLEATVEKTHKMFAAEFQDLLENLRDRLSPNEDGTRKKFKDATVRDNFLEFFSKFKKLKVKDGDELDMFVSEAANLVSGLDTSDLRNNESLRDSVASTLKQISDGIVDKIGVEPRRKIIQKKVVPQQDQTVAVEVKENELLTTTGA